ncbi:excalibur calcium-binding domain-containing protein [Sphingobium chungbukense]|nr:excalibur calcium-binding domain-containing protein [Sphingobium chungbukense]
MAVPVHGHPGGLNAQGCHNNRKTGDYHCHKASTVPGRRQALPSKGGGRRIFANCSAARAAGAAPVRVGDPGYGRHLDRDADGVGCE